MIVPCPTCQIPLSSDQRKRYCVYCGVDVKEFPAEIIGNLAVKKLFFDQTKAARLKISKAGNKSKIPSITCEGRTLELGIDYHVENDNYIVLDVIPADMDFIVVTSEKV